MILNLTYKNILYYLCLGTELNLSKKYSQNVRDQRISISFSHVSEQLK